MESSRSERWASIADVFLSAAVEWVQKVLGAFLCKEPVIFVCVAYDPAAEGYPLPTIGVGTMSEREAIARRPRVQKRLREVGDVARMGFYNPAHYRNFDVASLRGDRHVVDRLGLELERAHGDWDCVYRQLGVRLSSVDWSNLLPVSGDFVVFVTDLQMSQWRGNFLSSVPAGVRDALRKAGWIPDLSRDVGAGRDDESVR